MSSLGEPQEISCAARFFLSNEASTITGPEPIVDGDNAPSRR